MFWELWRENHAADALYSFFIVEYFKESRRVSYIMHDQLMPPHENAIMLSTIKINTSIKLRFIKSQALHFNSELTNLEPHLFGTSSSLIFLILRSLYAGRHKLIMLHIAAMSRLTLLPLEYCRHFSTQSRPWLLLGRR